MRSCDPLAVVNQKKHMVPVTGNAIQSSGKQQNVYSQHPDLHIPSTTASVDITLTVRFHGYRLRTRLVTPQLPHREVKHSINNLFAFLGCGSSGGFKP
jgi:membrane-bound metal-dependent hydrolase YbcI (DUF457 family)